MFMDHTESDVRDDCVDEGYNGDVGWITTISKMKVTRVMNSDGDDSNGDDDDSEYGDYKYD
jgi:hypothetical protein